MHVLGHNPADDRRGFDSVRADLKFHAV